ncbi:hypothetical protein EAE96_002791 [Botrytis aclada]|nr:hypothetical protein EAE96_002791 [Botrytis aclada]
MPQGILTFRNSLYDLILEDCEINIQRLNGDGSITSKDVNTTKENIIAIQKCNKGIIIIFLQYICKNYRVYTFSFYIDTNDIKEVLKYLNTILVKEFILKQEKIAKLVLGANDLILLLIYH